ncbi:MAG: NAD(P)H-dependent glycerol-3-phosphate dehydrogenase [Candidatus Krumholzibacteriia bacterium]
MTQEQTAVVLGTGSWGTSFARHLAATWRQVTLWGVVPEQVRLINETHENPVYLPGVMLPPNVRATLDLAEAAAGADAAFVVVPSHVVREVGHALAAAGLPAGTPVICLAKGMELATLLRLSEVLEEEIGHDPSGRDHPVGVLLGPSHAEEVARGLPTAVVLAGRSGVDWVPWRRRLNSPAFRVYTNNDLPGVEISSAFKNVIAIAAGLCDGLALGDNTRGAVMTRGLAELARLGRALGGQAHSFYGLAGIGDMITTCTSRFSRNRNFGEEVGRGVRDPQAVQAASLQVVEGVSMTQVALKLGLKYGIELPITQAVHDVIFSGRPPVAAMRGLMERAPRAEDD